MFPAQIASEEVLAITTCHENIRPAAARLRPVAGPCLAAQLQLAPGELAAVEDSGGDAVQVVALAVSGAGHVAVPDLGAAVVLALVPARAPGRLAAVGAPRRGSSRRRGSCSGETPPHTRL